MNLSQNMLAILLLLLVGGGLFLYKSFFSEEVFIETETIAREALNTGRLYDEINSINFDRAFFNSPLVNSLVNFYVDPAAQALGRTDPFNTVPGSMRGPESVPLPLGSGEGESI